MSWLATGIYPELAEALSLVAGVESCTLLDWPGRVSMVLFLQGCNLRCPWCHNPALLPVGERQEAGAQVAQVVAQIRQAANLVDAVVISGGEATIHQSLPLLVGYLQSGGLRVKLETNGSKPEMLRTLITSQAGLQAVAMDIKAPLWGFPERDLAAMWQRATGLGNGGTVLAAVRESFQLLCAWALRGGELYLRTTRLPWFSADIIQSIEQMVPAYVSWRLQQLQVRGTPTAAVAATL